MDKIEKSLQKLNVKERIQIRKILKVLYYLPAEYLVSSLTRMRRSADNKPSTILQGKGNTQTGILIYIPVQ